MSKEPTKFERTTDGLRDALMSEMEDLRAGVASANEANAFATLAEKVIKSLEVDAAKEDKEYRRQEADKERIEREQKRELKRFRLAVEAGLTPMIEHKHGGDCETSHAA